MKKGTPQRTLRERFESNVPERPDEGCWLWTGATFTATGYGMLNVRSASDGAWRPTTAHRISYELYVGEIPVDLVIDHLCRTHPCVNPLHLEAVPQRTNLLRGDHPSAVGARRQAILESCAVDGCDEPIHCQDLCSTHYQRMRRTGSPTGSRRASLETRIEKSVFRDVSGCWIWTGSYSLEGYPRINVDRTWRLANRFIYESATGSPAGRVLRRLCKMRPCVNPDHMQPAYRR